jgi:hypothetical protein
MKVATKAADQGAHAGAVAQRPTCIACVASMNYTPAMNESLTIRPGTDLARALQEEARLTGLSKGELARQALAERLERRGRLTVMSRHFGAMRGPADLSTNKTYRRTWGRKPT